MSPDASDPSQSGAGSPIMVPMLTYMRRTRETIDQVRRVRMARASASASAERLARSFSGDVFRPSVRSAP